MQRNLEQLRALHAHHFWDPVWGGAEAARTRLKHVSGSDGGNVVAKLGPMILECGLLASLSFAKQKGKGYETLLNEVGRYLSTGGPDGRHLLREPAGTLDAFIRQLANNDSDLLRRATAEALLYIGYLKRFAPPRTPGNPTNSTTALPNPVQA